MMYNIIKRERRSKMTRLTPYSDVSKLSGVGKTRKEQLNKLGIFSIKDLLFHFPRAYENRGNVTPLSNAFPETSVSLILTVASEVKSVMIKKGFTISKFRAFDETGSLEVVFFNSSFVKDVFHTGATFRFYGKISYSKKTLQLTNPKYEAYVEGIPLPDFVPIYSLTDGLSSKFMDKLIATAINETIMLLDDPLPEKIRMENSLPTLSYTIKNIHFPSDKDSLRKAIERLAFDEMFYFGVGISKLAHTKSSEKGVKFSACDLTPILNLLPYELTQSQKNAVNDIYNDTVIKPQKNNSSPMTRILVGDVGTGKTICAILAIYIAVKSGYQAALMAPTEILARQHYAEIKSLFSSLGIEVELLLGSTKQKEKERIHSALNEGTISVIIGTHALISDKVSFKNLGLIITDEQHRFGVNQRAVLKEKTISAHMLVMSATPIPRTLALTMYGDLDVSRITEYPAGRLRVDTFVIDESYRQRLYDFISKQISLGGQCYVVCPAIESRDGDEEDGYCIDSGFNLTSYEEKNANLKNVTDFAQIMQQNLPSIRIESLHGKMKSVQKDEIMHRFSEGKIDVLVSTTVIEVGVNVPNAALMIIENAERFGLSQLHQLRGRVGRGTRKSYCVLVQGSNGEKAKNRLEIMRTTYDGFEIAEKDLLERGPGDFFASISGNDSIRQSGGFKFKMASLSTDTALMNSAFSAAKKLVSEDPNLTLPENALLYNEISKILLSDFSTIS